MAAEDSNRDNSPEADIHPAQAADIQLAHLRPEADIPEADIPAARLDPAEDNNLEAEEHIQVATAREARLEDYTQAAEEEADPEEADPAAEAREARPHSAEEEAAEAACLEAEAEAEAPLYPRHRPEKP